MFRFFKKRKSDFTGTVNTVPVHLIISDCIKVSGQKQTFLCESAEDHGFVWNPSERGDRHTGYCDEYSCGALNKNRQAQFFFPGVMLSGEVLSNIDSAFEDISSAQPSEWAKPENRNPAVYGTLSDANGLEYRVFIEQKLGSPYFTSDSTLGLLVRIECDFPEKQSQKTASHPTINARSENTPKEGALDRDPLIVVTIFRVLFLAARSMGSFEKALSWEPYARAICSNGKGQFKRYPNGATMLIYPDEGISVGFYGPTAFLQLENHDFLSVWKVDLETAAEFELNHQRNSDLWSTDLSSASKALEAFPNALESVASGTIPFPNEPHIGVSVVCARTQVDPFLTGTFQPGTLVRLKLEKTTSETSSFA